MSDTDSEEKTYHVFTRCPWQKNPSWPQGWEPLGGAEKTTIETGVSRERALEICKEGNEGKNRGQPGETWFEFESE
jgi:hypothetical protein